MDRPWRFPVEQVLIVFFFVTLPLVTISIYTHHLSDSNPLVTCYFLILAGAHFFFSFTLYLQLKNRTYFSGNYARQVMYYLVPVGIFVLFALYRFLAIGADHPRFDVSLLTLIASASYFHWAKQCYGVSQLVKVQSGLAYPAWIKRSEHFFFLMVAVAMGLTFCNHAEMPRIWAIPVLLVIPFLITLGGFASVYYVASPRSKAWAPMAYFFLQSLSGFLVVYSSYFLIYAFALHYVEYMVLMQKRCFSDQMTLNRDRVLAFFNSRRRLFFVVVTVLAVAANAMIFTATTLKPGRSPLWLTTFDGLFVFHYYLDTLVWRSSVPQFNFKSWAV